MLQAADEERYDLVREGVVIFMGSLAKHLSLVRFFQALFEILSWIAMCRRNASCNIC